jgi:uncharacterized protein (DUF427 family)
MKAVWQGAIIAESDKTIVVEGNHYFPPESIKRELFHESDTHSRCGWKGTASYYSVKIDGKDNKDCAWFYPEPMEAAKDIKGHVAFWRGIEVTES